MHFINAKGILSSSNGMNICRGCLHGCIYCDSRSKCYQINHKFEDIEIKANAISLLEDALKRKRAKVMIGTGSMSDPYLPLKESLLLTRKALEVVYKYGCGIAIQTKSNRILNDLDLIKKINDRAKAVVEITLTTYDDTLAKIIEPNVSVTSERYQVLLKCHDLGIPTVVWITPILPFINDNMDNLVGLLNYCKEAKVKGIICFGMGVTLREGDREYFYQKLDEIFPGLKKKYIEAFGYSYECNSFNNEKLMDYFYAFCEENNIMHNPTEVFRFMKEFPQKTGASYEQLNLFDF